MARILREMPVPKLNKQNNLIDSFVSSQDYGSILDPSISISEEFLKNALKTISVGLETAATLWVNLH